MVECLQICICINGKEPDFFLLKNIVALPFWVRGWVQKVNCWFTFLIFFLFVETFLRKMVTQSLNDYAVCMTNQATPDLSNMLTRQPVKISLVQDSFEHPSPSWTSSPHPSPSCLPLSPTPMVNNQLEELEVIYNVAILC